tara:strand:+ start:329 stop:547 length:219 start_codon:yes stop_codon:yes gene_type:complete
MERHFQCRGSPVGSQVKSPRQMSPMGLGVNLAGLDAAELTIAAQDDWRSEADRGSLAIRNRGRRRLRFARIM